LGTKEGNIETYVNEQRRAYYRLDPEQKKHPGAVIVMPNLPNDQYHWDMWQKKGYKTSPQELLPDKKLIRDEEGQYRFDITAEEAPKTVFKCDICGRECVGEFGLNTHKRMHEKDKA
jgi:hypothetical protein